MIIDPVSCGEADMARKEGKTTVQSTSQCKQGLFGLQARASFVISVLWGRHSTPQKENSPRSACTSTRTYAGNGS
eukprot:scaffold127860_cov50-Prasinocladus_malaysianus.AAC.1